MLVGGSAKIKLDDEVIELKQLASPSCWTSCIDCPDGEGVIQKAL